METINDIVREMRGDHDHSDLVCYGEGGELILEGLADRIEKAYSIEKAQIVQKAARIAAASAIEAVNRNITELCK